MSPELFVSTTPPRIGRLSTQREPRPTAPKEPGLTHNDLNFTHSGPDSDKFSELLSEINIFKGNRPPKVRRTTISGSNEIEQTVFTDLEYAEFDKLPENKRQKLYFVAKLKPIISPDSTVYDYLSRIDMSKVSKLMSLWSVFQQIDPANEHSKSSRFESNTKRRFVDTRSGSANDRSIISDHGDSRGGTSNVTPIINTGGPIKFSFNMNEAPNFFENAVDYNSANNFGYGSHQNSIKSHKNSILASSSNPISSGFRASILNHNLDILPGPLSFLGDARCFLNSLMNIYTNCVDNGVLLLTHNNIPPLEAFRHFVNFINVLRYYEVSFINGLNTYSMNDERKASQLNEIALVDFFLRKNLTFELFANLASSYMNMMNILLREEYVLSISTSVRLKDFMVSSYDNPSSIIQRIISLMGSIKPSPITIDQNLVSQYFAALRWRRILDRCQSQPANLDQFLDKYQDAIISIADNILEQNKKLIINEIRFHDTISKFLFKVQYEVKKSLVGKLKQTLLWRHEHIKKQYNVYAEENDVFQNVAKGFVSLDFSSITPKCISDLLKIPTQKNISVFANVHLRQDENTYTSELRASRSSLLSNKLYKDVVSRAVELKNTLEQFPKTVARNNIYTDIDNSNIFLF